MSPVDASLPTPAPAPAVERWIRRRSHHHSAFPVERVAVERDATITVCLPAREEAATIGPIVEALIELVERGAVDQVLVVDAGSEDGTAEIARRAGAEVHSEDALMPEFGPVMGKGDAMWRALSVATGDVVCYLDADSGDFGGHFACGLVGPLVCERGPSFVKAFFRRPFRLGGVTLPEGGGRVTELTARPLLNRFYPELAGVRQPLAGEIAARRRLLEALPFATGYAIEMQLLLAVHRAVGLAGLAQVDLDVRANRHQSLAALGPMAYAVLQAVVAALEEDGRLAAGPAPPLLQPDGDEMVPRDLPLVRRPPMASVRSPA